MSRPSNNSKTGWSATANAVCRSGTRLLSNLNDSAISTTVGGAMGGLGSIATGFPLAMLVTPSNPEVAPLVFGYTVLSGVFMGGAYAIYNETKNSHNGAGEKGVLAAGFIAAAAMVTVPATPAVAIPPLMSFLVLSATMASTYLFARPSVKVFFPTSGSNPS